MQSLFFTLQSYQQYIIDEGGYKSAIPAVTCNAALPYITGALAKAHYGIRMRNIPLHAPLSKRLTYEPQQYAQRGIRDCDALFKMIFACGGSLQ